MAVIQKLPKYMADLIAAGEVVERPASVVKELVENAVDAGATTITVEIQRGGISFIRVTDDGNGISKEDMKTAFLSHATSKIKTQEDLNKILTLGFRGEALPSIAAVSKVTMISKTRDNIVGKSYLIEGGNEVSFDDAGCADGTTVIVRNIFYNTPARMKFLKKDITEGNYVSDVVEKIALCYPNISFRFIRDYKQVFATNGDGSLENVCYAIFKKDFSDGLLSVNNTKENISVKGLITPPFNCRGSRGMQYFFVNGRSVKNTTIMAAFENAYKNSVMVGKFPGGVLFINLPPQLVDVNVHPAKTEVRFSDEHAIFDAVFIAVKMALNESSTLKHAEFHNTTVSTQSYKNKEVFSKPQVEIKQTTIKDNMAFEEKVLKPLYESNEEKFDESIQYASDVSSPYGDDDEDLIKIDFPVTKNTETKEIKEETPQKAVNPIKTESDFKLIGEAYKTYIFIEINGTLCVIDKHAAHERILFNKLKNQDNHLGSQILLSPVTVSLGKEEYSAVIENIDVISKAGFDVEDFGNGSVIVRSCPIDLDNCEIAPLIDEIASYLTKSRRDITNEHLDWIYHNVACRSAIKAGDNNTNSELYELCKKVVNDSEVRYCPHGRPVMIEISKYELEKQFGRV